jgi:DNA-directed RNA polymerase subunit alpha
VNDYRLVLPRRVEQEVAKGNYARFVISPLERGYGFTVGEMLKRAMLSSLGGAAVTAVRVNEGLAVYEQIPNTRETVSSLVLQLKQLRPVIIGERNQSVLLQLDHVGAASAYARDILCPPNVRILNPDLYLLSGTTPESRVSVSIAIEYSRGYVAAEEQDNLLDGYLAIDANFSPVKRVVYDVDPARVRQKTNYDKLIYDVWTDGTLSPQEALSRGAALMIRHLQVFDPESTQLWQQQGAKFAAQEEEPETEVNPLYDVPIEVLDLSTRVFNSLRRTGITSIGDVLDMLERGEESMLAIRNFGQTSLDELKERLQQHGYLTAE